MIFKCREIVGWGSFLNHFWCHPFTERFIDFKGFGHRMWEWWPNDLKTYWKDVVIDAHIIFTALRTKLAMVSINHNTGILTSFRSSTCLSPSSANTEGAFQCEEEILLLWPSGYIKDEPLFSWSVCSWTIFAHVNCIVGFIHSSIERFTGITGTKSV